MFVYSLYSYFDIPNAGKESITNSMFKITLSVPVLVVLLNVFIEYILRVAFMGIHGIYYLVINIL